VQKGKELNDFWSFSGKMTTTPRMTFAPREALAEKEKKQWLLEEMFESRFPQSGGREEG
jgi:hypothetical protein